MVGMSNEMEGAIVGGLIGAAAVLTGVVGNDGAIRIRDRRARVVKQRSERARH
jgi:hypothetical protein